MKKWEDYDTITCLDGEVIDMQALINEQDLAKAALAHLDPFFAALVNRLRFVYTFHVDTQATDGYNLFINPQFTAHLTLEEKVFVLAHEIMHNVLDHMRRSLLNKFDHQKANIAADYEVNITLKLMEIVSEQTMKKIGALYDTKYANMGFESIYMKNPDGPSNSQKQKNQNGQKGQKNQNNQSGQGNGSGSPGEGGDSNNNAKKSADWKAGYEKAMADWKAGKLKI